MSSLTFRSEHFGQVTVIEDTQGLTIGLEGNWSAEIFEHELIYALLHQYGAFNSPVWFNLGVPGRKQTASACFISSVGDSLQEIINYQSSELEIFKGGSGSGANLSNLRSSYEKISAGSYTSGPLAFMKGADAYAGAMKSGGATRNAAAQRVCRGARRL